MSAASCSAAERSATLVPSSRASGTVAFASLGARGLAFIADEDAQRVTVVDVDSGREIASAGLDAAPGGLLVLPSGMIVVTLPQRSQLALLAFDGQSLTSRCAITTAAEPVALALTPNARTLLVASAWGHRVTAYETATLREEYQVELAREPRAVVVDDEGTHAFVAHAVGSRLSRVDLTSRQVEQASLDAPLSFEVQQRVREFTQGMVGYLDKTPPAQRDELRRELDKQIKSLATPERTANQGFS
ncbi:MAG TPA: hypothetical protein VEQ59_10440, partial [Polyangiaceae bacterium]|nr:hypothetical protein [Polyangiaceae bacterium]